MIEPINHKQAPIRQDSRLRVSSFAAQSSAPTTQKEQGRLSSLTEAQPSGGMFSIAIRRDPAGHVMLMGKPTRKRANALLNIPICQATRRRLDEQFMGSLSMGASALLEWALDELKRQGIALEVRPYQ